MKKYLLRIVKCNKGNSTKRLCADSSRGKVSPDKVCLYSMEEQHIERIITHDNNVPSYSSGFPEAFAIASNAPVEIVQSDDIDKTCADENPFIYTDEKEEIVLMIPLSLVEHGDVDMYIERDRNDMPYNVVKTISICDGSSVIKLRQDSVPKISRKIQSMIRDADRLMTNVALMESADSTFTLRGKINRMKSAIRRAEQIVGHICEREDYLRRKYDIDDFKCEQDGGPAGKVLVYESTLDRDGFGNFIKCTKCGNRSVSGSGNSVCLVCGNTDEQTIEPADFRCYNASVDLLHDFGYAPIVCKEHKEL